jgi:hypothetical protein
LHRFKPVGLPYPAKLVRSLILFFLLSAVGLVLPNKLCAQSQPITTRGVTTPPAEPPYRREFVYSITSTSTSGIIAGGGIRSSQYWKPDWLWFWSLQVNEIKNRKELRIQSSVNGDPYIRGKTNFLYAVRPSFGLERVVLHKAAEQGVQVSAMVSAGPTIGLEVPYYIYYVYDPDPLPLLPVDVRREPHNPTRNLYEERRVAGSASFTTGLAEAKLVPGAHLRASVAFEYGRYRESVTGLEAGVMLEAYSRRPILVPETINPKVFSSVFLTLFFGRRS